MPQIVNALLSRHNFILLGLRGQAKSRILRALVGAARRGDAGRRRQRGERRSFAPISEYAGSSSRERATTPRSRGWTATAATWRSSRPPTSPSPTSSATSTRSSAARGGHVLSDELTIHYGMLPRANRGIFALNELPDLAGKVQVGLFNIMQEGDVQIKGYPVRLPLDVQLCFTANPEDYTARGKIITPLKDRIGSEIITHYPETVQLGMAITEQEAWTERAWTARCGSPTSSPRWSSASPSRRAPTSASTALGRLAAHADQVMENVVSNAERRAVRTGERGESCRASRTSSPRCRRSPARSSSSTRASWWAGRRSRGS